MTGDKGGTQLKPTQTDSRSDRKAMQTTRPAFAAHP
jgi:hypothetical protein